MIYIIVIVIILSGAIGPLFVACSAVTGDLFDQVFDSGTASDADIYDDYDDYDDDYDSYGTSGISPELTVAAYEAASNTCTAVCAVALGVWGISLVALAFGEDMVDALKKPLSASDDNAKEPDAPTSPEADEHEPQRPQGTRFK